MKQRKNGHQLLVRVYANPRYRGKHVIVVDDKVFVARSATDAPRLFDRVIRAYPRSTPTLVYVPRADALVPRTIRREQDTRLRELSERTGRSLSELVREAVEWG